MKVDFEPKPDAILTNKRNWLIYQFVRFRMFQYRAFIIVSVLKIAVVVSIFNYVEGWQMWVLGIVAVLGLDMAMDKFVYKMLKPFYADMGEICFPDANKEYVALKNLHIQVKKIWDRDKQMDTDIVGYLDRIEDLDKK